MNLSRRGLLGGLLAAPFVGPLAKAGLLTTAAPAAVVSATLAKMRAEDLADVIYNITPLDTPFSRGFRLGSQLGEASAKWL